jgi:undecaprenyl diphosphate synthase
MTQHTSLDAPLACDHSSYSMLIPSHVAIIMDGNRRWAKKRGLPDIAGHVKGVEAVIPIVRAASDLGVKVLTMYAFSTENWGRTREETSALMSLFNSYLLAQKQTMIDEGVRLHAIGNSSRLPSELQNTLKEISNATRSGGTIDVVLALNYGGRDDIRRAALAMMEDHAAGKLHMEDVSERLFSTYLDTAQWEDPQLLIRTSGEFRVSNFLLWQISYAEVYVTDTLWPDFNEHDFSRAILDYQQRERRWGN